MLHKTYNKDRQVAIQEILKTASQIYREGAEINSSSHSNLKKLNKLISHYLRNYGDDAISDLAGLKIYAGKNDIYIASGSKPVYGDLVIASLLSGNNDLLQALIALDMHVVSRSRSEDSTQNDFTAFQYACFSNKPQQAQQLLMSSRDYFRVTGDLRNIFSAPLSLDIYQLILEHMQDEDKRGELKKEQSAPILLAKLRITHLTIKSSSSLLHETIDDICNHLTRLITSSALETPVTFNFNDSSNIKSTHNKCHKLLFGKNLDDDADAEIDAVHRRANSKVLMLFSNPERCLPFLRFLNDEFTRYCAQYPTDEFKSGSVNPESFTWESIYNITIPVAGKDYITPKKNSRLQEFLLHLLKENDMGREVIKWLGFVPDAIASEQIGSGNLVMESVYGSSSLFHGALSHMLQTAMIIYACQRGDIQLPGTNIKELIQSQVKTQNVMGKTENIWSTLRDQYIDYRASFTDPFRVNEVLMRDRGGDMPEIAAFLRDSFIGQTKRLTDKIIQQRPQFNNSRQVLNAMSGLEARLFYANDNLISESINKYQRKGHHVNRDPSGSNDYATAIRKPYPTKKEFKHLQFNSDLSSRYEVTTKMDAPPGSAVYIGGADVALGEWGAAFRMYYDHERERWAFNLPRGVELQEFKFMIGPMYPQGITESDHGMVVFIDKDEWNRNTLDRPEDDFISLISINSRENNNALHNQFKELINSRDPDTIKQIVLRQDEITGNTVLHYALLSSTVDSEFVRLLIKSGADVCMENKRGESPVSWALGVLNYSKYNPDTFGIITSDILKGAKDLSQDNINKLVASNVCRKSCKDLAALAIKINDVRWLSAALKHAGKDYFQNGYDQSIIDTMVENNQLEHINILIKYQIPLDAKDKIDCALVKAILNKDDSSIKKLLDFGANVDNETLIVRPGILRNKQIEIKLSAVVACVRTGSADILSELLKNSRLFEDRSNALSVITMALYEASVYFDVSDNTHDNLLKVIKLLVNAYGPLSVRDNLIDHISVFSRVINPTDSKLLDLMSNWLIDIAECNEVLMKTFLARHEININEEIKNKINKIISSKSPNNPTLQQSIEPHTDLVSSHNIESVDVNACDNEYKMPPLVFAIIHGKKADIMQLLKKGADVDIEIDYNRVKDYISNFNTINPDKRINSKLPFNSNIGKVTIMEFMIHEADNFIDGKMVKEIFYDYCKNPANLAKESVNELTRLARVNNKGREYKKIELKLKYNSQHVSLNDAIAQQNTEYIRSVALASEREEIIGMLMQLCENQKWRDAAHLLAAYMLPDTKQILHDKPLVQLLDKNSEKLTDGFIALKDTLDRHQYTGLVDEIVSRKNALGGILDKPASLFANFFSKSYYVNNQKVSREIKSIYDSACTLRKTP